MALRKELGQNAIRVEYHGIRNFMFYLSHECPKKLEQPFEKLAAGVSSFLVLFAKNYLVRKS